jgi:hypothetical protein
MLLTGYSGIRMFYNGGDSTTQLSSIALGLLVLCSFLTGMGGNGGLTASMNANAKSWPEKRVRPSFYIFLKKMIAETFQSEQQPTE